MVVIKTCLSNKGGHYDRLDCTFIEIFLVTIVIFFHNISDNVYGTCQSEILYTALNLTSLIFRPMRDPRLIRPVLNPPTIQLSYIILYI